MSILSNCVLLIFGIILVVDLFKKGKLLKINKISKYLLLFAIIVLLIDTVK